MAHRRSTRFIALSIALAAASASPDIAPAQSIADDGPSDPARHVNLEDLNTRQRVGQLFLVAHFAAGDDKLQDARTLVAERGIGGIVIQSGNNIFRNDDTRTAPAQVTEYVETLQRLALEHGGGVPLFVAVDQEGDGEPFTHLRSGFTALPSAMAIGATWRPEDAEAIGRIVGEELSSVGVNVLLGPVLDVLADPRVDTGGDIGTRAFGGHPFWVASMGSAYVRGVHAGGGWKVMTVAKHFPGHGGSDRLPDQEVATVVKDLAALRTIELPPFAAITAATPGDRDFASVSEALMTSHIRYAGLQGNIQRRTGPISFDREGLQAVMELEPFAFDEWRAGGGLIVSDSLGVPAVRRWFSPLGEPLANRRIARDALMAGNDVLTIAEFADVPAWSVQMANIIDTLDYFERHYDQDRAFAERVDDAVRRILARKHALMPQWTIDAIAASASDVPAPGSERSRAVVDGVARRAITAWKAPSRAPGRGERIAVITPRDPGNGDGGPLACADEPCGIPESRHRHLRTLGPTLVEQIMLERYGSSGTGVVDPGLVASVAFCELERALSLEPPTAEVESGSEVRDEATAEADGADRSPAAGGCDGGRERAAVLESLRSADWIIFAFGALDPDEIRVLRGLLLRHANQVAAATGAQLAVLSFGSPYLIDATNLSGLDAYVSAYTKIPSAIEAAIGVLFGDLDAPGHAPVSVEEAGYRLSERLQPPPGSGFPIALVEPHPRDGATAPAKVELEIGPIVDMNGNPVPDRSVVFIESEPADAIGGPAPVSAQTVSGVARAELNLVRSGDIVIRATMAEGVREDRSIKLRLAPSAVEIPNRSSPAISDPAVDRAAEPGSGDQRIDGVDPILSGEPTQRLGRRDLLLTVMAIAVAVAGSMTFIIRGLGSFVHVRAGLSGAIGGLGAYVTYALLVLVQALERPSVGAVDSVVIGVLGAVVGLAFGIAPMRTGAAMAARSTLEPRR